MRYLAIGAHPDDCELKCFGTLAKLKALGHEIGVCILSNGGLGSMTIASEELMAIRHKEAVAAAAVIGAELYEAGFDDNTLDRHNEDMVRGVAEIVRRFKPDVIFANPPADYHTDHVEASWLALYGSFASALPNFRTESLCLPVIPVVYYYDAAGGLHFEPTEYVDITETMDLRIKAFLCHKSQLGTAGDPAERTRIHAAFRGLQCGVAYAEAFRPCLMMSRVAAFRVLP